MGRMASVVVIVLTAAFVAAGSVHLQAGRQDTPEGAVKGLFAAVQARNWEHAYDYVAYGYSFD